MAIVGFIESYMSAGLFYSTHHFTVEHNFGGAKTVWSTPILQRVRINEVGHVNTWISRYTADGEQKNVVLNGVILKKCTQVVFTMYTDHAQGTMVCRSYILE